MTEFTAKAEDVLKNPDILPSRSLGEKVATLLATRVAIQNLIFPVGERFQNHFETCLKDVKETVPELDSGMTFLHMGDLEVEAKDDLSKIVVRFEARKLKLGEKEKMDEEWQKLEDLKAKYASGELKPMLQYPVTEHSSKTGISQPETDLVKAKREES